MKHAKCLAQFCIKNITNKLFTQLINEYNFTIDAFVLVTTPSNDNGLEDCTGFFKMIYILSRMYNFINWSHIAQE